MADAVRRVTMLGGGSVADMGVLRNSLLTSRPASDERAGSHVTRRHPVMGPCPYQRSHTSCDPGDSTSTIINNRSQQSCRNRWPAPSI
jgi:hypothetical protein